MYLNKKTGMALPLVLITMLVLGLLGGSVLQYGVTDTTQVARDLNRSKAFYAARSGADAIAEYLIKNPTNVASVVSKTTMINGAVGDLGDGSTFSVNVEGSIANGISIISEGNSNGVSQRVRLDVVRMNPADIWDDAIYTNADLDISQMKTIVGDVTSAGSINYANDYAYEAHPYTYKYYPSPEIPTLPTAPTGPNLTIENNQVAEISGSYHYSSIDMSPNATLIFNLPNDTMKVVVDNLTTKGSVFINTSGSKSRLELYITDYASIQTPLILNNGNPNSLIIVLADGATFDMTANGNTNAFIYGPNALVSIQSAFSTITGAIIADYVVKMPNGTQPNIGNVIQAVMDPSWDPIDAILVLRRSEWRDVQ